MAFELEPIYDRKETGVVLGQRREAAVGCWFTSQGKGIPRLVRFRDEEGMLLSGIFRCFSVSGPVMPEFPCTGMYARGRFAKICGVLPCCFIRRTVSGCWFFQTERELGRFSQKVGTILVKISLVILSKRQYHRE